MSVDTKGCVVTENKDVFKITELVNKWWSKVRKENNVTISEFWKDDRKWASPRIELTCSHGLNVFFKYKGEDRRLFVALDCDCDLENHEEIDGNSCIWFSLGHWGNSVEVMKNLMEEFKEIGESYVDDNDCDDVDFYKI